MSCGVIFNFLIGIVFIISGVPLLGIVFCSVAFIFFIVNKEGSIFDNNDSVEEENLNGTYNSKVESSLNSSNNENHKIRNANINPERKSGQLTISYSIKNFQNYGKTIHNFLNGTIYVPYDNFHGAIALFITDTTKINDMLPVISRLPEYQSANGAFLSVEDVNVPYQRTTIKNEEWSKVPLNLLLMPYSGVRILRVTMFVINNSDAERLKNGQVDFSNLDVYGVDYVEHRHQVEGYGYLEEEELFKDSMNELVKLFFAVTASDGIIDDHELQKIHEYIDLKLSFLDDKSKSIEYKRTFDSELNKYLDLVEIPIDDMIKEATDYLKKNVQENIWIAAYDMCVQIATSDENLDPEEKDSLKKIANTLNISKKIQDETFDRYIKLNMVSGVQDEELLGITKTMSKDEKLAHLNKEYNKWRSRVTSSNKNHVEEANIRIEKIAQLRQAIQSDNKSMERNYEE